ncbi:MAG TPA: hypothetical protein EYP85_15810 [Armatimonadetes bacterium]|nr:hypothetical protein [Armatimonadota bacterium]
MKGKIYLWWGLTVGMLLGGLGCQRGTERLSGEEPAGVATAPEEVSTPEPTSPAPAAEERPEGSVQTVAGMVTWSEGRGEYVVATQEQEKRYRVGKEVSRLPSSLLYPRRREVSTLFVEEEKPGGNSIVSVTFLTDDGVATVARYYLQRLRDVNLVETPYGKGEIRVLSVGHAGRRARIVIAPDETGQTRILISSYNLRGAAHEEWDLGVHMRYSKWRQRQAKQALDPSGEGETGEGGTD